jgi:hypothetical protein
MLYYLPSRVFDGSVPGSLDRVGLEIRGLGHLEGAAPSFRPCRNGGPDGGGGLVVAFGLAPELVGVFKDTQTWVCCDGGDVWVGWPSDQRPTPETLLRPGAIESPYGVTLADGHWWTFTPTGALPLVAGFDATGEYAPQQRPQDAAHYGASEWIYDWLDGGGAEVKMLDIVTRLAVCLGARYRVTLRECLALQLFSEEVLVDACMAALGIKKKDVS